MVSKMNLNILLYLAKAQLSTLPQSISNEFGLEKTTFTFYVACQSLNLHLWRVAEPMQ